MPKTEDDLSFFVYADNITTEAFDNAQDGASESIGGPSEGAINMGDAGSAVSGGTSAGNGTGSGTGSGTGNGTGSGTGSGMGNGTSAGMGM